MSRAIMQQALDMLVAPHPHIRTSFTDSIKYREKINQVIEALRQALAQPVQEPVAWQNKELPMEFYEYEHLDPMWYSHYRPLYTAPPKPWAGLTDEEMPTLTVGTGPITLMPFKDTKAFIRKIEALLKEKNT